MEKLIIAMAHIISGIEEALESQTDKAYHDAEELCENAGFSLERQVWTLAFVAAHLAMWRSAVNVYQLAREQYPTVAQKLQELADRVQKQAAAVTVFDIPLSGSLSDNHDASTSNFTEEGPDLPVKYVEFDTASLPDFIDGSGGVSATTTAGFGDSNAAAVPAGAGGIALLGHDLGAVHLDDDFAALD